MKRALSKVARLAVVAVAVAVAMPSLGEAQEVSPDASLDAEARALFEAGRTAFDAGRYLDALAHFEGAYRRSQRPQLLYNVAVAADRAGRVTEAIVAYEKFLEAVPDEPQRASLEARVRELRALPAGDPSPAPSPNPFAEPTPTPVEPAPTVAPAPTVSPSAPSPALAPSRAARGSVTEQRVISGRSRTPGLLLVAGGGAVALGGVASLVSARVLANRVAQTDSTTWADVEDDADRVPRREAFGYVLLGVGVVAAGAGIVLLLLPAERSTSRAAAGPRLRARLGLASLSLEGEF